MYSWLLPVSMESFHVASAGKGKKKKRESQKISVSHKYTEENGLG